MTERIDHAAEARAELDNAQRWPSQDFAIQTGESKADVLAAAQVHATLALVEQQRIANIMALASWTADPSVAETGFKLDDLRMGVAGEVWEGLGLS